MPQRTRKAAAEGDADRAPVQDINWGWAPPYDDRKTEIVLIGVGMDDEAINTALEGALLTAEKEEGRRVGGRRALVLTYPLPYPTVPPSPAP